MTHPFGALQQDLNTIIEGLEYLDQGLSIFDSDLRLVAFNQRCLQLLDIPPELSVAGTSMEAIFRYNAERGEYGPGDIGELVRKRLDLARRLEPHCFERERGDGTVLEIRGNPLPDGGFITTYTDITERKRIERELTLREQQYRTLVEHLPDFVVRYDTEMRRTYVNPAWEAASGLSADEVVNVPTTELPKVPRPVAEEYTTALERSFAYGTRESVEFSWVNARGETLNLQYLLVPERDQKGKVVSVLAVGRDVTEIRRAENQQLANLHFFQSMDRVNRAMVGSNDLEQAMNDVLDVVLSVFDADRASLIYPCDPDAPSWKTLMERTHPEYPGVLELGPNLPMEAEVARTFRVTLDADGPIRIDAEDPNWPTALGRRFNVRNMMSVALHPKVGKPWLFMIHQCRRHRKWTPEEERLFREIGLRLTDALTGLLAFRNLCEHEHRLQVAVHIAQIGYWDRELRAGRVNLSDETRRIFGLSPRDGEPDLALWHRTWQQRIHPQDKERLARAAADALREERRFEVEYRVVRPDGEVRDVHSRGEVTRDASGRPTRLFGTVQDITERKRTEETLRRLNRELQAISHCNQTLVRADNEKALLDEICRVVCDEAGYRLAWVGFTEPGAARTIRPVTWAATGEGPPEQVRREWHDTESAGSPAARAIRTGVYACIQDLAAGPDSEPWLDEALQRGYRSVLALPLNELERTFGVFVIYAAEPHAFTAQEIRLLEELAGDLAFGITVLRARAKLNRSTQELQRTNLLLSTIIDAAPVAIIGLDLDGKVQTVWNPAAERMLGWSTDEVMGRYLPTVPRENEEEFERFRQMIRKGESLDGVEVLRRRRDGSPIYYSIYASPLHDADGRITGNIAVLVDYTQRRQAEEAQRKSEEKYRRIVDTANEGIWMIDPGTATTFVNARMAEMLGYEPDQMMGRSVREFMFEEDVPALDRLLANRRPGRLSGIEIRYRHRDGRAVWTFASMSHIFDDDRRLEGSFGMFTDITERKRQQEQLLYQAHYDPLTNLPNRFLSLDRLHRQIKTAHRYARRIALLYLDLDDFKKVNDALGHEVGDQVLVSAAARLRAAVREEDTVGRLGGDEFVVLVDNIDRPADVCPVADKIIRAFQEVFPVMGRHVMLTASLGIAVYPDDGEDPLILLRNADTAMYHSKSTGRNTYHFFTDAMNQNVARRLQLEEQLRIALERQELSLAYQPIVAVATGAVVGAEVLLRWTNGTLGEVIPEEFIEVAEQTGLIIPIGDWVITKALNQLAEWRRLGFEEFRLSLNVSPRQFRRVGFVERLERELDDVGVTGSDLILEVTEGVLLSDESGAAQVLEQLRRIGVRIAMDDFGTGYSSLSYLRNFPFDGVKIDRSFIGDVIEDPHDRELVTAAIRMAKGMGLRVVAEGVETADQLAFLRQEACEFAQGYYFSRPVSADTMVQMIEQGVLPHENGDSPSSDCAPILP